MATTNDLKNGMTLDLDGQLWTVVEFQHVKPGKGGAFVRTKLKSVLSGKVVERTFNANVEAAVLAISVEIFQARTAAGGSIESVDFAVTPYRLSKNLLAKVTGLLGPYLDTDAMVG